MKRRNGMYSFGMPMVEIIISIGMLMVLSVFILQMFLAANRLQQAATDISRAVIEAERIAEGMKGSRTPKEAAKVLNLQNSGEGVYRMAYDSQWRSSEKGDSFYAEIIPEEVITKYGTTTNMVVSVYKNTSKEENKLLYRLPVTKYVSK